MVLRLSAALLLLAAATPARAQESWSLVFVSPMGEVFGGDKGNSPDVKWFSQADRNHDGRLSREEMVADADRFFAVLDRDGDKEIGPAEIAAYEADLAWHVGHGGGQRRKLDPTVNGPDSFADAPPGPVRYLGKAGAARFNYLGLPEPVIAADTNLNRGVSIDEFERAAQQRFALLDGDSSGALELKELGNPSRKPG